MKTLLTIFVVFALTGAASAGDHAIFICPPGKSKVYVIYGDDSKYDEKGKLKEGYFEGYVVEGRGGEKDKEFPFTSRLFRLDQTGKKGDILYYQGRRCVEADE